MNYKIKHVTASRVRIELPFICSPDVKAYLRNLSNETASITKLHFYNDQRHLAIFQSKSELAVIHQFLSKIEHNKIRDYYTHPTKEKEESLYDLVTTAFYKRFLIKLFIPLSIRKFGIIYRSLPFAVAGLKSLTHLKLDMNVLDFAAIFTSLILGDIETASTIIFLLKLGNKLDHWSQDKSIAALERAIKNPHETIWIQNETGQHEWLVSEIAIEDVVIYSEGQEIIFDGEVVGGEASVDESSLTGELFPVFKVKGDKVSSNTLIKNGELFVRVSNNQPYSKMSRLIELIKAGEGRTSSKQRKLIEKGDQLVKFNFIGMALTYFFSQSLAKTLSFLLVDFSCALKLSTPVTYLTAIKEALNHHVVIKSTNILDTYQLADTFVFDKTGTLTNSQLELKKIVAFAPFDEEEVLKIGACLEEHIYHPIANTLVETAKLRGIIHDEMHGPIQHIPSKGVRSSIGSYEVAIGSQILMIEDGLEFTLEQLGLIKELEQHFNLLFLNYGGTLIGLFCFEIPLRGEVPHVLEYLKAQEKELILLTGDKSQSAEMLTRDLPFDEVLTGVSPEEKYVYVKEKQQSGATVLMIGDGLNDSAALSQADVSVVMGASSDISRHISDVIFSNNDLGSFIHLERLINQLERTLKHNFVTTLTVNSALIIAGLSQLLQPNQLALFHNLTTFWLVSQSFQLI